MKIGNDYVRGGIALATVLAFWAMGKAGVNAATLTILLLVVAFVYFFTEIFPIAFTAMLVPIVLSVTGILKAKVAFSYFGEKWVLVFLFMFMVGEGLFRTGAAQKIGEAVVRIAGKDEVKLMFLIMCVTALLSGFLSNTATTVSLMPIVVAAAYASGISPKRLLLPLAWAASLGGTLTVIGTPPNGIINSVLDSLGMKPFGFFEFAKLGLPITVVGIALAITVGRKFLPSSAAEFKGDSISQVKKEDLRSDKMWLSVVIFAFTILCMMLKILPYQVAAALGAVLMVAFGCITAKEAFNSVSWTTVFLFAGMLPLSAAMKETGAAKLVGHAIVAHIHNPYLLLLGLMLVAFALGNAMSHTATTAILSPLAVSVAQTAHLNPYTFLMAIAMIANVGFWTPVSTPPNTIVFGPGEYTFMDYIKAGAVIEIALFILVFVLTPILYPIGG
ncbi:SLC13 family permease [Thermococcus barophilus]|uniref:Cation transporter n=1 Tax=Thermococcus barophilus TaxID=55802 RepID=A0A0S1X8G9_THEBA|nr:SLC13 family permease [Thermococcus barophilus]ALM74081.1 Cation transporter [Thermococcus barophilus]